ncbi:MAG: hypothetical protein LBI18_02165 [Planctomycetaceae bacterium]|nr:hypothetical protein [Planctomycetaceae bacterium]
MTILVGFLSAQEKATLRVLEQNFDLTSQTPSKKFIELGWDIPNTAYLKEHHKEMQQTTPFDGMMLALEALDSEGKKISSQHMMTTQKWEPAWFETAIADLKSCKFTTFTDNFIRINYTPGSIKWNDNTGWKIFCEKSALCAKIAKETGLKGLAIDFEPYGDVIFRYDDQSGQTFEETQKIVRKRGAQWMKAIVTEYPDMVLLTLFILDFVPHPNEYEDTNTKLEAQHHYGLLPAYFNGMLDVVPPEMKIVDGCESGYYLNGNNEYIRRAWALQAIGGPALRLIVPENRQKYINQVQIGFGFYLDMYTNPEGHQYYRGPKDGGTRLDRLKENLSAAKKAADEYVWIYGEQRRWWKPVKADEKWEHWETALPSITSTILRVKNPVELLRKTLAEIQQTDTFVNLIKNGDFSVSKSDKIDIPAEWQTWQHEPTGTFSHDSNIGNGSAKATKIKRGCFLQELPAKSGECYYISVDAKRQGTGQISVRMRWKDAEGKWIHEVEDGIFPFKTANDQGWQQASGIVCVPEGAAFILCLCNVSNQETENDTVWFDNVLLIKLE